VRAHVGVQRTHCTSTKCVGAIPHKVDDNPFDRLLVAADDAVLVPDGMLQLQSLFVASAQQGNAVQVVEFFKKVKTLREAILIPCSVC
jgi:hypothetical protein